MLTKREKDILKKAKRENPAFISVKSSIISTIKSSMLAFLLSLFMVYIEINTSLPMVIMCVIFSFLVYLVLAKYLFGSWSLCFKLTFIYLRIKLNRLRIAISRR